MLESENPQKNYDREYINQKSAIHAFRMTIEYASERLLQKPNEHFVANPL
jgi:hypothetical protein